MRCICGGQRQQFHALGARGRLSREGLRGAVLTGRQGCVRGAAWHSVKDSSHGELEGNNCCDDGVQRQQVGAEMRKAGKAEWERHPSARPTGGKGKIATLGGARSLDHCFQKTIKTRHTTPSHYSLANRTMAITRRQTDRSAA